uniref:Uncharacterized protein n=1 Tax=Amorphochlora amoebiformis TaxID=1561963 RepID=A0A7S0CXX8_9EUKA
MFALIAPIDLFRPFFERVGVTIRKILASLCSTLYDLRSYLLTQRNAKALRSMFSSESPWMSTMQSALVTLESFVQIIEPPQAVEIFGPGVLLPVIKFMCEQMAKEITANQGRKKVTLQLKTAYLPEYDSHIRKVLTLFIRLTAVLVHKWGTNVVEILRKTGGPTAPSLVLNLWIHHYKKMDAKTQKLTLLAMGKLLEARVQIVCVKAMAIGQCCSANFRPDYSDENKTPLKKGLQFVRNARKLLNPRNFQDKKVRQYVGRCCEDALRHGSSSKILLRVPTNSPSGGTRSAGSSPVSGSHGKLGFSQLTPPHVQPSRLNLNEVKNGPKRITSRRGSVTP